METILIISTIGICTFFICRRILKTILAIKDLENTITLYNNDMRFFITSRHVQTKDSIRENLEYVSKNIVEKINDNYNSQWKN